MASLADELAEAMRELAAADDSLKVAELHVEQLQKYYDSGTSYAAYPDISKEFDVRNRVVRDTLARKALAAGKVRDLEAQLRSQFERQKSAEAAKKLAAENEKKRQEELAKNLERKPAGREYTPG
jgi:hypothetical protein